MIFSLYNLQNNTSLLSTICKTLLRNEEWEQGHTGHEWIWKKRTKTWAVQLWVLLHDNTPAHQFLLANEFLVKMKTTVLPHQPYSLDLTPGDFFLFPELARHFQGYRFQSSYEVKCVSQEWPKTDSKHAWINFTGVGKSVLLYKGLISKEDMFLQFNS